MNMILILSSIYAALYSRVIGAKIKRLCTYVADGGVYRSGGVLSHAVFGAGVAVYAAAVSVIAAEVLNFVWSVW